MAEGGFFVLVEAEKDLTEKQGEQVFRYFKVKRKSGGGECVLSQVSPSLYKVAFADRKAQQRVLAQRGHIVQLASESIKLTVSSTDDPSGVVADEPKDDSRQAIQEEEASLNVCADSIPSALNQSNSERERETKTQFGTTDFIDKEFYKVQLDEYLLNYFQKNEEAAGELKHYLLRESCTFRISEDNKEVKIFLLESERLNEDCVIRKRKNIDAAVKQISQKYTCHYEADLSNRQVVIKYPNLVEKHTEIYNELHQQFTVIVGPEDEVARLLKLVNVLSENEKKEEKCSSQFILPGMRKYLLIKEDLEKLLKEQFPTVVNSLDKKRSILILEGNPKQVYDARLKLSQTFEELQEVQLTISNYKIDFLSSYTPEEFEQFFSSLSSPVLLEIDTTARLCGTSAACLLEAERIVNSLLQEQEIDIPATATELVIKPAWQEFLCSLQYKLNSKPKQLEIFSVPDSNNICSKLVIVGFLDAVKFTAEAVQTYLSENSTWTSVIKVQHLEQVDYFYELLDILNIGDLQITTQTRRYPSPIIELHGPKSKVIETQCTIEKALKLVIWETLRISRPGAFTFFQGTGKEYLSAVGRTTHCLLKLKEPCARDSECIHQVCSSFPHASSSTEVWCSSLIEGGFVVSVHLGDISKLKVDAIVNAANENLKHGGGVAKAIQDAGGDIIVKESKERIKKHGTLKTGETVMTSAGNLPCQKVIHAVGPRMSEGGAESYGVDIRKSLQQTVYNSLTHAEREELSSVALPCISSGSFGVPLEICSSCIVEAIKEFIEEHAMKPHTLKNIILIDDDLEKVAAFQNSCKIIWKPSSSSPCFKNPTDSPAGPSNIKEFEIVSGEIECQKADVLIVPLTKDLHLTSTMVSKCILQKAGDILKHRFSEQSQGQKFEPGNVVPINTSEISTLDCKWLHYVICSKWDGLKGKTVEILTGSLLHSLELCHDLALESIALPVIGTGKVLGVPHDVAVKCLLDTIRTFKDKNPVSWIKQISIVIHPKDCISPPKRTLSLPRGMHLSQPKQVLKTHWSSLPKLHVHRHLFKQLFRNTDNNFFDNGKEADRSKRKESFYNSLSSSIDKASINIRNMKVEVDFGDIVTETVDVIVNSVNVSYGTTGGVSKSIFSAAGQAIEDQVKQEKPNIGNVFVTNSGGLKSKVIMHLSVYHSFDAIQKAIHNVIQECEQRNFRSVAFPAIGTGQGKMDPTKVADVMFDAIALAVKNGLIFNLTTIRIVILHRNIFNIFKTKLENRLGMPSPSPPSRFLDKFGSRWKKSFKQEAPVGGSEIFETKNDLLPAVFDVMGLSQNDVKKAKEKTKRIFNENFSDDFIEDEEIAGLSSAVIQNMLQWGADFNVHITIKKGCTNEIRVQGLTKNVKEVLKAIDLQIKDVLKKKLGEHHQYQIYQVVQWQYEEHNQYSTFDRETNFQIESHFNEGTPDAFVEWNGKSLYVEFQKNTATVLDTNDVMNIKRQNKLSGQDLPRNWAEMSSGFFQVLLEPESSEYQDVVKNFQKTATGYEIVKVERVQNAYLRHAYEVKKKQLIDKHGPANLNELHLFHGTSASSCICINKQGFNRSFAGKNATKFGKGVYFAVEAAYSAKKFCPSDSKGLKYIYFASVLVGQYTKGQSSMNVPPPRSKSDCTDLYDSLVDDISKPMKHVIFHDDQAYPDYLITFR